VSIVFAHYDGKNFVPDGPVDLPPGTKVRLDIATEEAESAKKDWLRRLAEVQTLFKGVEYKPFDRESLYP
jgi:hypothetical protein